MAEHKLLPGNWEGHYLDVRGYRCNLKLSIKSEQERLSGKFQLEIPRGLHDSQTLQGGLSGEIKGEEVSLILEIGKKNDGLNYRAQLSDAGSHATQALYGNVVSTLNRDFGGGIWIAWRYKDKN